MNFANVNSITIPEGDVRSIAIGGVTVWQKPNPLPYDAEVEYVESDGTQYVDTQLSMASGSFRIKAEGNSGIVSNVATGVQGDATSGSTAQKRWFVVFNGDGTGYYDRGTTGGRVTFTGNLYDTGKVAFAITLNSAKYIRAFSTFNAGSGSRFRGKIYAFQLWDAQGTLVRDFIPVRVGTVGYLYDRANPTGGPLGNGLYGSATATPLVAGPDKTA